MLKFTQLKDLVEHQQNFQKRIGNILPIDFVSFENVQEALRQNFFQEVELQEFMESSTIDDQQEELIDFLLFLLNKYIYLGINSNSFTQSIESTLWSFNSNSSFCNIESLARLEQTSFISFVRQHCIYKPWKVRKEPNCVNGFVDEYFLYSLDYFKNMANIIFDSYEQFYNMLIKKCQINIDRQNNNY